MVSVDWLFAVPVKYHWMCQWRESIRTVKPWQLNVSSILSISQSHHPSDFSCSVDMWGWMDRWTDLQHRLSLPRLRAPCVEMTISALGETLLISDAECSLTRDVANDMRSILIRPLLAFSQQKTKQNQKRLPVIKHQHLRMKEAHEVVHKKLAQEARVFLLDLSIALWRPLFYWCKQHLIG